GQAQAALARRAGEPVRAEACARAALDLAARTEREALVCDLLDELALAVADQEGWEDAARILGAGARAREALGARRHPVHAGAHRACRDAVCTAIGTEAFGAAWEAGARLDLAGALAYVRRGRGERKRPTHGWESLTPTE